MRRIALRIMMAGVALLALASAGAEEQSWSKRTPPPVKFAPLAEEKAPDWSGFHVGVNSGAGFSTKSRDAAAPGSSVLPK